VTKLDVLRRARLRIDEPGRWSPNPLEDDGRESLGQALMRASSGNMQLLNPIEHWFITKTGERSWEFGKTHTHAQCLALIDRAIAAEELSS
jgi:hypothetical protein